MSSASFKSALFFCAFLCLSACAKPDLNEARHPSVQPLWLLDGEFASPESAIYDADRELIYVSNVNGYAKNGAGFLSALQLDGELVAWRWLEGLNAPTGMAISGDKLFVVDFDRLVQIDIPTKTIKQVFDAPDDNPGLNDVTMSSAGEVYVSASNLGAVYKLVDNELYLWAQSEDLQYANGLYADETHVYVAGLHLRRIEIATGAIEPIGDDAVFDDLESIESDGRGGYFVTMIGPRPVMHINAQGEASEILSRDVFSADIDYVAEENLLLAPSGGDAVAAFNIDWDRSP